MKYLNRLLQIRCKFYFFLAKVDFLHSSCLSLSQPCVSSVGSVAGIAYCPADLPQAFLIILGAAAASGRQEGSGA